jgi:large subunit ribosomal protein L23
MRFRDPRQIILKPLVTEKSHRNVLLNNAYSFIVAETANKQQIKWAVEQIWDGAKVLSVRTIRMKGKPRRHRWRFVYGSDWKKAIIKLDPDGNQIDVF